ncbi:MAG: hypothetical protein J6B98_05780 [Bacilli bacterium]|nr:hypothetical protein [Bacilli bacterium]
MLKKYTKRIIAFAMSLITPMIMHGCSKKDSETQTDQLPNQTYIYNEGEHLLASVDKTENWILGKDGKYGLLAPDGYKIKDYDYDYYCLHDFDSFVFENDVKIMTSNPNNIGNPLEAEEKNSNIYMPGEHVIADVKKDIDYPWGIDGTLTLTAPDGYEILDYDYDKGEIMYWLTTTYVNSSDVVVNDINDYGVPIDKIYKNEKDYYDIGEHKIVKIIRGYDGFLGKTGFRKVDIPSGYKVVDYDYDYNNDDDNIYEFETIVFTNTVPVTKNGNDFGIPLENILTSTTSNVYEPGDHIVVYIERLPEFIPFTGTKLMTCPDGYDLLDYDYDKTFGLSFNVYVYVNNTRVEAQNPIEFGVPVITRTYKNN